MLFNSFSFLVFLAVVLAVSRIPSPWRLRKVFLLLMSYVFYAAWNPPFVALLWLSTVADWFFAKWMHKSEVRLVRHLCLAGSLVVNLGLLGFFKYGGFLLDNVSALAAVLGIPFSPPAFSVILPVGISFYTFQTLSYTIDVYRRNAKPWYSFLDYALYVTFFPQLVAGPIVRAVDFLPQCEQPKIATRKQLAWGFVLMTIGLFNKAFVADILMSPIVERIYGVDTTFGFVAAWTGTLAFAVQIFCDFAGYSTIAIGVALMLGFELPDNFRFPYGAIGFSDFWRRWHISLSTWLRDYLYISLGGNRKGKWQTYRNLALTMLLGGLWHGASWNFVVWGGLHGAYLIAERLLVKIRPNWTLFRTRPAKLILALATFVAVNFAWVYFRADTFEEANRICLSMVGANGLMQGLWDAFRKIEFARTAVVVAVVLAVHLLMRNRTLESVFARLPWPLLAVALSVMLGLAFISLFGEDHAFIYFQF